MALFAPIIKLTNILEVVLIELSCKYGRELILKHKTTLDLLQDFFRHALLDSFVPDDMSQRLLVDLFLSQVGQHILTSGRVSLLCVIEGILYLSNIHKSKVLVS